MKNFLFALLMAGFSLFLMESTAAAFGLGQGYIDFDGDGKTDYSVVRNTGGGGSGQLTWFNKNSNGTIVWAPFGIASDFKVVGDFDGDGKSDITIWRPDAPGIAAYYIFQSSTNTMLVVPFGQSGDDPTVVDDYTGDGKTDPAVYRAGANAGDPSTWWYRASSGPNAGLQVPTRWGQNGDFPAPGDYDGDGSADFVVQRNGGGGRARFFTLFANGTSPNSFMFGTPTDVIVPGDYDGDGKTDIAVARGSAGQLQWHILPSSTGVAGPPIIFGASATDSFVQGDYDGDGKTDVAVWRPVVAPANANFFVLGSTAGFTVTPWGLNGDFPIANYNRH